MIERLHTAARRYCIERIHHWYMAYADLQRSPHSDAALNLFPRYQVLDAILVAVESFVPGDFTSLAEARELLVLAGRTATSPFTAHPEPIAQTAMAEERTAYCDYITDVHEADLAAVEPLFFRRVLSDQETARAWEMLRTTWGAERDEWLPPPDPVAEFPARAFRAAVPAELLRALLDQHRHMVWELRESGPSYEIETRTFDPHYNGAEGFWFDERWDWVIFASHEDTIAVGGRWLLDQLQPFLPLAPHDPTTGQ